MKTFKLVSLAVMEDEKSIDVPLDHGLIINKEDEHSTWLLEAYTRDLTLYDYFKKINDEDRDIIVQVVITKSDNDPVFLQTKISCLQLFEEHISVLLQGQLRRTTKNHSQMLLQSLLQQGFAGDALLSEFIKKKNTVPRVK
ncbi:YwpF family protein [Neobacillus sp. PS3-12]|jgi:hypothetical protein|uniref:YwpF family protein n=1 Tax=Neobacillus sp. PS3-12 TaxID=3070677 RepID=UPI0027DFDEC9|nr:YwpF family protein [Neobacillus sp. PS3-12]WML55223.1 YwpF family protein [Neobacillus sp. PS3-12]